MSNNPVVIEVRQAAKAWIDAGSPQTGRIAERYQIAYAVYTSLAKKS